MESGALSPNKDGQIFALTTRNEHVTNDIAMNQVFATEYVVLGFPVFAAVGASFKADNVAELNAIFHVIVNTGNGVPANLISCRAKRELDGKSKTFGRAYYDLHLVQK